MKFWILALASFAIHSSEAEELCNPAIAADAQSRQAIVFLQTIAGYYEGDKCELSVQVCTGFAAPGSMASRKVGQVLLIDKKSRSEFYLPIDLQSQNTRRTRFHLERGRRMFHYEFTDRNPDPSGGSFAEVYFEAVKFEDLSRLKYVEFGLRRPADTRIHWLICELNKRH